MLQFTFAGFEVQQITKVETMLTITARALTKTRVCPSCSEETSRIHSDYQRHPQDLPISGLQVQLILRVRRFRCLNSQCARQTFAERLPELPVAARQTGRLGIIVESIAVVLSGQAGSRLAEQLAMPVSADTLLRRAKKKSPALPTPRVLGVDDFAFRRGHTYGTILVNLETHRPVDLLEDRSAASLAQWLRQHPGVEIISRDRSKDYQRGATDGAPAAQQVIDRWHLLKNLREAIERFLSHTQMPTEISEDDRLIISPRQKRTGGERVRAEGSRQRRLELYQQGGTLLGIARQLHLGHRRVRHFVRSPHFPEWGKPARTKSAIDPYRTYLQERWQQGCQETGPLWQELQARGFTGSRMMVYRWIQVQREKPASTPVLMQEQANRTSQSIAPRHLAWLFLRDPEHLEPQDKQTLSLIRKSQQIEMAYGLAQHVVTLLKARNAQPPDTWLWDCRQSGISDLVTFAQGLEKEGSALHAAFTLPYSNGPVEGKIHKLKYIKRSMYGRSGFPLLRQKVLKAA